ncbi:MAG: dTDP-4-dehydrorhamnose reductase [Hyphomicrobiales bacterium]
MRVLVIGQSGQIARVLSVLGRKSDHQIATKGRADCDLMQTANIPKCLLMPNGEKPEVIVNAAAYTAVDNAECDGQTAYILNRDACQALALACKDSEIPLVHISTDYVYKSDGSAALLETNPTGPINVYGHSKLAGEFEITKEHDQHIILRTAWVFSSTGNNFVKTVLRLAADHDELQIVADQIGNPTAANDLGAAIITIIDRLSRKEKDDDFFGVYNFAGRGDISWANFARTIFSISKQNGGPSCDVRDILTDEFPSRASRQLNSRLDTTKFETVFGPIPSWEGQLQEVVKELVSTGGSLLSKPE